jgi:putative membrane protein
VSTSKNALVLNNSPLTRRPRFQAYVYLVAALFLLQAVIAFTPWYPTALGPLIFNLLLNIFVVMHMLTIYRGRDVVIFYVVTLVISNLYENIGILTGFPFGSYDYTDALGPKIFLVPGLVGASYVGAAYASWVMSLIVLRQWRRPLSGWSVVTVPAFAAIFMVMWDLTFDPNSSTVRQWWIWKDGGAYFGVPVTNFLGWYLTVFTFMLIFAWWMRVSKAQPEVSGVDAVGRYGTWLAGVAVYFAMGMVQVPTESIAGGTQVIDGSGQLWNVVALQQALGLVTLFTMGTVVALALQAIGTAGGREPRTSPQ